MNAERLFTELYGRAPSDAERNRLLKAQKLLKLPDSDEMWAMLIVYDHYIGELERSGKQITTEVKKIGDEIRNSLAEKQLEASRFVDELTKLSIDKAAQINAAKLNAVAEKTVIDAVNKAFREGSKYRNWHFTVFACGLITFILATTFSVGYFEGWSKYQTVADARVAKVQAEAEKTIAAIKAGIPSAQALAADFDTPLKRQRAMWSLTPDGQIAYLLSEWNNGLQFFFNCREGKIYPTTDNRQACSNVKSYYVSGIK